VGEKYRRIYADQRGNLHVGAPAFGNSAAIAGENSMYDDYDDFGLDLVDDNLGEWDDDDDLGYEDFGDMDYASLGAMDYASLGEDDEDEDEMGRRRRRRKRGRRRGRSKSRGRSRSKRRAPKAKKQQVVQKTILVGQSGATAAAGTQATVTIRPQFDFVAEDVTFQGSTANSGGPAPAILWNITAIQFGDRIVFSNPIGVPINIFAVAGFMRGLVKGAAIAAGLDIQITGTVNNVGAASTGNLVATFTGLKRGTTGCGPGAV
jgi:hypothetical protein